MMRLTFDLSSSIILLIFFHGFPRIETFTPVGRLAHSSVLVGSGLYFFGGNNNLVFYLNISQSFSSENPPWVDLTSLAGVPFGSAFATASLVNVSNHPTVYIFGGYKLGPPSFMYAFNPQTLDWNISFGTMK